MHQFLIPFNKSGHPTQNAYIAILLFIFIWNAIAQNVKIQLSKNLHYTVCIIVQMPISQVLSFAMNTFCLVKP